MENIKNKDLLVVYNSTLGHVTHKVRGLIYAKSFTSAGWRIAFVDEATSPVETIVSEAKKYKIIYFIKVCNLLVYQSIKNNTSAVLIFDCIDALWLSSFKNTNWNDFDNILDTCDILFTENFWSALYLKKFNKPIYQVPIAIPRPTKLVPSEIKKMAIGWVGSNSTVSALDKISREINLLWIDFPDLELWVLGADIPASIKPPKPTNLKVIKNYDETEMLTALRHFDIGLFPPPGSIADYEIRGAQKTYIYMASGAIPASLNYGDSSKEIIDNVNGLLIYTQSDWHQKIKSLLDNPRHMNEMRLNAFQHMHYKFTLETTFKTLEFSILDGFNKIFNISKC